jgi:hypothetical protein
MKETLLASLEDAGLIHKTNLFIPLETEEDHVEAIRLAESHESATISEGFRRRRCNSKVTDETRLTERNGTDAYVFNPDGSIRMKRVATLREGRRPWVPPQKAAFPDHPFRSVHTYAGLTGGFRCPVPIFQMSTLVRNRCLSMNRLTMATPA